MIAIIITPPPHPPQQNKTKQNTWQKTWQGEVEVWEFSPSGCPELGTWRGSLVINLMGTSVATLNSPVPLNLTNISCKIDMPNMFKAEKKAANGMNETETAFIVFD